MKTPKRKFPVYAVLCALALAAVPVMLPAQSDDLRQAEWNLGQANYEFAFDLLNQIVEKEPATNIFISPFSVSTAMQMVCEGAAGATRSEIEGALKIGAIPPAQLGAAWEKVDDSINWQARAQLNLADGVWYQKDFRLKPDFAAVIMGSFHAEVTPVNFHDPATATLINQWAARQT